MSKMLGNITDPPYNVDISNSHGLKIQNDNMKEDEKLFFVLCFQLRMQYGIDVRNIINMLQPFVNKKKALASIRKMVQTRLLRLWGQFRLRLV